MPLNDFLGIGKILPIDKLIDVVSNSVGRLSKSYFDKKDAETKAFKIKKIAEARAEEMKIMAQAIKENFQITGGIEYKDEKVAISSPTIQMKETDELNFTNLIEKGVEERAKSRINYQQTKKQLNIETVTAYAADELKDAPEMENKPIDEDWTTRFFNIVEDISNEEMQALWGRILAGEIKHPKSYSLRTLELLKNLSKEEAEIFTKFAQLKISVGDKHMVYNQDRGRFLKEKFNISFTDLLLLTELGLIASEHNLEFSFNPSDKDENALITYGKKGILLKRKENTPKQGIQVLVFTKAGIELSNLIEQKFNTDYIKKICSSFKHPNVEIIYGDVILYPNGTINILNEIKYEE